MDEKTNNLVLAHLRAIRADLAEIKIDLREIKGRLDPMIAKATISSRSGSA